MRLLNRYILKEIAAPSVLAFCVIAFMGVANELRERYEDLPVAYISLLDLMKLVFYFLPAVAPIILFITYMMGILLAFVRFSQHNEITAMKAAGIPLKRMVMPVIAGGAFLTVASFLIQDCVQPWALNRANALVYRELPKRITLDMLPVGVMHSYRNLRVYFGGKDAKTGTLRDIHIRDKTNDGRGRSYYAESAQLITEPDATSRLLMRRGRIIFPSIGGTIVSSQFSNFEFMIPPLSEQKIPGQRRMMPLTQLFKEEAIEEAEFRARPSDEAKSTLRKTRLEIKERIVWPMACLAVSLVAAPLAVRGRRAGKSYSFAIGFTIGLVYFILTPLLEPRGLRPLAMVILRGLIPNVLFCLVGVWALWRVDRV